MDHPVYVEPFQVLALIKENGLDELLLTVATTVNPEQYQTGMCVHRI